MTVLSDLLVKLDPVKVIDGPERRADFGLDTFPSANACVESCQDFLHFMTLFHQSVQSCVWEYWPYYDYSWNRNQVFKLLRSYFGENGVEHAHLIARTGIHGGLYGLMKRIAKHAASEFQRIDIHVTVEEFLMYLDDEEKEDAAREYSERFEDYLPPELLENNGLTLLMRFEKVLENHPYMIRNVTLRI
ncbi:MAG: hypothetical protein IPH59_02895 [bacterium]|nr:hypothetical protein [bacterium]